MNLSRYERLRKGRQGDATWQCTARRAPLWIMPKNAPPYRPYIIMVVDQDSEFMHHVEVLEERPTAEVVLESLLKAMQGTLLTLKRKVRPARIFIDNADLSQALAPRLAEMGIGCDYRAVLPQLNAAMLGLEAKQTRREPVPGLLSLPGVTVPLAGELFAAAADYYRQAPWRWMENFLPIEVHYPPDGPARYALVLGRGGETFGLSLYDSLADIDVVFGRICPEQPHSRPLTWLSLVLEEATVMSFADLDAMEQYGWPVAGEKAYPLAIKSFSDREAPELPTASELAWLAAALRVLPDFVNRLTSDGIFLTRSEQAVYPLPPVHAGQKIELRYPASSPKSQAADAFASDPDIDLEDLEEYIEDWYWDEDSHVFARQMGAFLFQFLDHLAATGLSRPTMNKHESNCWCIGWLECNYGDHDTFTPDIFLGGPNFLSEFERKVSDSKHAVASYQATWRKLEKYVREVKNR